MARSARAQRRSGWRIVRVMVEAHRDHRSNAAPPPSAHDVDQDAHRAGTLTRTAFSATVHCLTGCAMGEVLGMVLGTAFAWANWMTVTVAVVLAFVFGYSLTMLPLIRAGLALRTAIGLAFAADTASIVLMEIVDNLIMLYIPGAMDAGLDSMLFWGSLIASLVIAGLAALPLNRWLISRGMGHAVVHGHHRR